MAAALADFKPNLVGSRGSVKRESSQFASSGFQEGVAMLQPNQHHPETLTMNQAPPTTQAIRVARECLQRALDEQELLLLHDAALPSATTLIAGEPIRGSWWGHAAGALIYAALGELEESVAWVKLLKGKETLVHARLFPALVAIGTSRADWQLDGLSRPARDLLDELERSGRLRADALPALGTTRVVRELFRELELKLLAFSRSVHTDQGRHARELSSWALFQTEHGLRASSLPDPARAQVRIVEAVVRWAPEGKKLLPWARAPKTTRTPARRR
jgi:hypothetical protein